MKHEKVLRVHSEEGPAVSLLPLGHHCRNDRRAPAQ
jgi:hypothetical protein